MTKRWLLVVFSFLLLLLTTSTAQAFTQSCSFPGQNPTGIAVDNIHSSIWVALWSGGGVEELSQGNCSLIRSVSTGINPDGIAFDGANVWVANFGSNTVTEINAGTGAIVRTVAVGSQPRGVTVDNVAQVWVSNYGSNTVTRIGSFVSTIPVGSGPYFLAFNPFDGNIYVPNRNSNTVSVLNTSGVLIRTISTDSQPQFVAVGGSLVAVSCYSSAKLDIIQASTGTRTSFSSPHNSPTGISFGSAGVYGVENSGYAYIFSTTTNSNTDVTSIGSTNYDGVFAGLSFWITDFGGNAVRKLTP